MKITTDSELLAQIEEFLTSHSLSPSRFGRAAMGDAGLVTHLRKGRSLTLKSAEKVVHFMRTYRPASGDDKCCTASTASCPAD